MKLDEFDYDLPPESIAQAPLADRTSARLLRVTRGASDGFGDYSVRDLPQLLGPGDLLVFNDTRVIPARLFAQKPSGGKVEALLTKPLGGARYQAMLRNAQNVRPGEALSVAGDFSLRVIDAQGGGFYTLELLAADPLAALEAHGHVPLPPYIRRADEVADRTRYQTMFADRAGSAAAPTAGLHFTPALLTSLQESGVAHTRVTLHVGPGTFLPVREDAADDIGKHQMHSEWFEVSEAAATAVRETKARGQRVVAVGTTSVRTLEASGGQAMSGETALFITPGYTFGVVDGMLTNFHLPRSTLLIMVSAFAGLGCVRAAYAAAIARGYRFYSYGDACLFL